MNNLIGKKFRYKSKYGGLSDWEGIIVAELELVRLQGDPRNYENTLIKKVPGIKSENSYYYLDEIEIIN